MGESDRPSGIFLASSYFANDHCCWRTSFPLRSRRKLRSHDYRSRSFDELIGASQHRLRDREAKRFGGLEIDDQLELRRLLDREVGRLRAPEDLVHVRGGPPPEVLVSRVVAHQTAGLYEEPSLVHRRQPMRAGQLHDAPPRVVEWDGVEDQ